MRILFIIATSILLLSCNDNRSKKIETETKSADIIEVLYFHGKQRCITCNTIEKLTKEVVDSMANEKIKMKVIDITTDESLADKYEIAWSSLIVDHGGKIINLTKMGFKYAKNEPQVFKANLANALIKISKE